MHSRTMGSYTSLVRVFGSEAELDVMVGIIISHAQFSAGISDGTSVIPFPFPSPSVRVGGGGRRKREQFSHQNHHPSFVP